MTKRHKKIESLYSINIELDYAFFDYKIWKIILLIFGLATLIITKILYFQITLKLIIELISLLCFSCIPTVNLVLNFTNRRYLCDSIFIVLSAVLCFIDSSRTISLVILLLFNIFKITECYLWHTNCFKMGSALNILPDLTTVALDGKAEKIKPSRIKKDDICCVYQNEIIPVDGKVINGLSIVDYSNINCNDTNISVSNGSIVLSGGINKLNPIIIRAECDYSECFAKKIFDKCNNSLSSTTKESSIIAKLLNIYILVVFLLILVFSILIPIFTKDWSKSLRYASVLLLLACPYGVNSLLYKFFYSSIVSLFGHGILLSSGTILESLANIKTIICNKTSTVTDIDYVIEDVNPEGISIDNFLSLVLKVESISKSPMAISLRKYCNSDKVEVPDGLIAKEIPGKGIEAILNNVSILVGNASLLFEHNITTKVPDKPGAVLYVSVNNKYCGYIVFSNKIRKTAFNVLEKLSPYGLQNSVLLSCDLRSIVRPIANTLGFTASKSEIEPLDKSSIADHFVNNSTGNSKVLYLGNEDQELDASKHADVSMTSDAVLNKSIIDKSDVVSIGGGFETLPYVIGYSVLCNKFTKIMFWSFILSRLVLTFLSLIFNNIVISTITVFIISFVISIISSILYKRAEL